MKRPSLQQLYAQHDGRVTDKWESYLRVYDPLFSAYRDLPVSLLEIGIQNGGSLEVWARYFANGITFVGCDINPKCGMLTFDDPRISVVVGDAGLASTKANIASRQSLFDIIIDDGSHRSSDIIRCFAHYFPHLADGGVYVIEDLHCSYWQAFEGGLYDPFSSLAFFRRLVDVMGHEHWGVPKQRSELLHPFFTRYDAVLDDELLSRIYSVEFYNSVCIVRKGSPSLNALGRRIIEGTQESVAPGHLSPSIRYLRAPVVDEAGNSWSNQRIAIEDEIERNRRDLPVLKDELQRVLGERDALTSELQRVIGERDAELASMYSSTSWRVTAPMRAVKQLSQDQRTRARLLRKALPEALRLGGGVRKTLPKAWHVLRHEGLSGVRRRLANASLNNRSEDKYEDWINLYDTITDADRQSMRDIASSWPHRPLISVVMPTYNTPEKLLREAIDSVLDQTYDTWEFCIADDASTKPHVREVLEEYRKRDSRIKVVYRDTNGHISQATNSAVELATGEWLALLDHDDLLASHALFCVAEAILRHPDVKIIYSDEDKVGADGRRFDAYFKCDWNPGLFLGHNFIAHLGVYNRKLLNAVGGFRTEFDGAQDYDLALRVTEQLSPKQIHHIPLVLYHWRVIPGSTALGSDEKPYAMIAGERALNDHFRRVGEAARASFVGFGYRSDFQMPTPAPLVSIIIPTRNGLDLLNRCIDSIKRFTDYSNYEIIIVDNGSDDPACLQYFEKLGDENIARILRDERPFNYSALNNHAVQHAHGTILCLLNNDIEIISPDWLSRMVSIATRPGAGAVGAKLLYPDDTIQHGGVIVGLGGVAGHAHLRRPRSQVGYFSRAALDQNLSAVTAACLVVRKEHFVAVGGLNERDLTVAFNDVDFCLKLTRLGLRNVWSPFVELYHHESATRGYETTPEKQARFKGEIEYMQRTWPDVIAHDPAYNPNLSLDKADFALAFPPRVRKPWLR